MAKPAARALSEDQRLVALDEIQRRVLWLAVNIVHHANKVRPNPSGIKVGGHQASSASVVTILTELFFDFMRRGDKVSVKPHASPVLHAIQYLLGNLDRRYLTELRAFHGLQAYPSRTKDPDPVDFSTGSVGLGSVAPNFAALVDRFVQARFGKREGLPRRFISVLGDAELDEGSVWEAVAEPALAGLDNLIWIVDLNRQSLDRVVPGIRVRQLEDMFRANGWAVIEAKYGRRLQAAFAAPGGHRLRKAIDDMPNERYQYLLRGTAAEIAGELGDATPDVPDHELKELIADLGGHDFGVLREALAAADRAAGPAVVFAYTVKGWQLPIAGDPLNHSALLSKDEVAELRRRLEVPEDDEWAPLSPPAMRGEVKRGDVPGPRPEAAAVRLAVPSDLNRPYSGAGSTQRAFGQILMAIARAAPEAAERLVTVSPDVATSTNLGGWINKVGVWEPAETSDPFSALGPRLIEWRRSPQGQHIELGISETNLLMLLAQLGLAGEMADEPLLPIGTLYDPFVARALEAYIYGVYSGARFILVGTPSGVTLAPEGGAHQSVVTPPVGVALPRAIYWEPCFEQELECILLEALNRLHGPEAESSYLRLSTAPVDQALMPIWDDREAQRRAVLSGVYPLRDRSQEPGARPDNRVDIWATGVMVPHALLAAEELRLDGVYASVHNCVSPDLVFRAWRRGAVAAGSNPVVTVLDGHPLALGWVGSALGVRCQALGVTEYGQSGTPADLYREFGIDAEAIAEACFKVLG
ncbi:MAG TPA: pyruvate dehydrogenase [Candidatus Dormibacteraeota bacterium]